MTAGIAYSVEIDFGRDGTFGHVQAAITSDVMRANWSMGMSEALQDFAAPSRLTMTLSNADGAWSPDKAGATYRGLLVPGVLVRLRATFGGVTQTLWTGKVSQIAVAPGQYANEAGGWLEVNITAEDPMSALLKSEYVPPLLLNVRTDAVIRAMFEAGVFAYPYDATWSRLDIARLGSGRIYQDQISDLEQGYTTLAFAGDSLDQGRGVAAQTILREMTAAEAGGRFYWDGRSGKFTFHNRYHDGAGAVTATIGGEYVNGVRAAFGKDMANVVSVQYEPRAVGAPNTVLWEIDTPFTLRSGQERTISARYRDPDTKTAKVSALTTLAMQPGDLVAYEQTQQKQSITEAAPPLGREVSSQIGVTIDAAASSAKVTLRNPTGTNVQVATLRIRGTPLTTFTRDEVKVSDGASIAAYDIYEELLPLRAISDDELAAGIAGVHLARRKTPLNRWENATLRAGWLMTDAYHAFVQEQVIERTIGDRVALSDAWSEHDSEYIVVGEQHQIDAATAVHQVTWTLKPAVMETWFRIDASQINSADLIPL